MEFTHHGLSITLPDDWWAEADMVGFTPSSSAYPADSIAFPEIFLVRIADIGPVLRSPGVGIFNDSNDTMLTARERVVTILVGFRSGAAIPPVKVVRTASKIVQPYKLVDGAHRLYCSLAARFTHIPAVEGFDMHPTDG
jgi:hypothetical protein